MCAPDREEGRVELAFLHGLLDVLDLRVELERDAEVEDALDLRLEHVARQAVLRNAEAHHPAGQRPRLVDGHAVTQARQVIRRGEPGGSGAHHQHVLAGRGGGLFELPAQLDRLIAEEALDGVDAHRLIDLAPVAGRLTGVVADAAHHGRHRIVLGERAPSLLVVAGFGVIEPALDVLTRRTGVVARRQTIQIERAVGAPATGLVGERGPDIEGDRERLVHH